MPQRDHTPTTTIETWGVNPSSRVWIGGNNTDARREIELLIADAQHPPTGALDRAFIAPLAADEALYFARKLRSRLVQDSSLWIVYPKRGSPREHEFAGNFEEMVIVLFELGFTESGRANLTGDYTSTGFRIESRV
jgi:hypothetical protein